ncbi:MAG: acyl-CoA thioesterase [Oscillospiraceae bacterium]
MKVSELKPYIRKAYYYETDRMGIIHHSNYVRWLEEARVDMLAQAGYPFEKMEAQGLYMPVLSAECNYRYPVKFDEEFAVYVYITKFNGCSLAVEYRIINLSAGGKLAVTAKTTHCFADLNMKPISVKHSHPDIYKVFKDAVTDKEELEKLK